MTDLPIDRPHSPDKADYSFTKVKDHLTMHCCLPGWRQMLPSAHALISSFCFQLLHSLPVALKPSHDSPLAGLLWTRSLQLKTKAPGHSVHVCTCTTLHDPSHSPAALHDLLPLLMNIQHCPGFVINLPAAYQHTQRQQIDHTASRVLNDLLPVFV